LASKPTRVFKAKLKKDRIAKEATPNQPAQDEAEPIVLAWARVHGADISADSALPADLLLSGTQVHARIRCGTDALGYALFHGLWKFNSERIVPSR
jgi:hypothetical protein